MCSFHHQSAHDNVKGNVGIPNCLAMANTSKISFSRKLVPFNTAHEAKSLICGNKFADVPFKISTKHDCC